ncbi:SusE domain-containing protein [Sphingobacterium corticibacterium]|uniref:SusF/SusE family outer membrane protein n=1 Tax=Sphingobacterium corticibacterium TaxID=2484746 RepID=A0A4Q6XQ88_9SPHI|nr:SusE domain-containing protein [Sphingobacterium corticibacterium]RZF61905.1 SusF/SusE family outer membrane protein [Sphingobacterium corticibacterium]
MKTFNIIACLAVLLSLIGVSCSKDETKLVAVPGEGGSLQASGSSVVLTKENADQEALAIQWESADFGFKAAIINTLQIGLKGQNFEGAKEIAFSAGDNSYSFNILELNALLLAMELPVDVVTDLELRLKSTISTSFTPLYSNTLPLAVTPYAAISYLYVPGAYQKAIPPGADWVVETAESLISPTSNGIYTGIIYFPEADSEFKITPARSWDASYGDDGAGRISLNAGGNIKAPRTGNLELTVNTNENTITYKDHSWGIVGDAAVSWDDDTDMRYENSTQLWKITVELKAGEMKFRKNHDWGTNYGGANGTLNNDNIVITEAGMYDIVFDLVNMKYSLTKK